MKRADRKQWAAAALRDAAALGLLEESSLVDFAGRVPRKLLAAAKRKAGVRTDEKLLLVALSVIAGHDDFGERFLKSKGSVDPSIDLEL